MKFFDPHGDQPRIGLAYGPGLIEFLDANPGLIEYVEMPLEQLRHSPELGAIQDRLPLVLHCASLSVAGFITPSQQTLEAVAREASRTKTPWIGEHLAFVSADGISEEAERDNAPTNLTYTLCPQLSEETVQRVAENLAAFTGHFDVPIILENSPQYFPIPGSTMGMVDFIRRVVEVCNINLLLDLSHFLITALNTKTDAAAELEKMPLERVVEIHVSGLTSQAGVVWDDHAAPAPPEMFDLLKRVLKRARPRALTMEYNWTAFPETLLLSHLSETREILSAR